ncbi:hypothetical protein ACJ72_05905 [Emergomyces africanus]|uniref:Uncharacterized protein n=1 Tax=Emergomyces africanus TaxID=1955775 RepID=A0A1B7NSL7_9EURO|nr:hypothetical protein ACJ72_05905 [Emergomyces africanus]
MTSSTPELTKALNAAADSSVQASNEERLALIAACDKLKARLESPMEATLRILFSPYHSIVLRLAVDMKIFDAAAELSADGKDIRLDDLVSKVEMEPLLVLRVVRFLAALKIFNEVGKATYKTTPLAAAYVSGSVISHAIVHITSQNWTVAQLPAYFEKKGYRNPSDAYAGPFQYAHDTDLHCFDWLATQPRLQASFNVIMGISRTLGDEAWFEYFPASSKLTGKSESEPLVVDIGGGVGHHLIALKKHCPSLTGKLIVQDIPAVVDNAKDLPAGIEVMKHDFFTPQPVKHAKAYFLSYVLHDWPDKQSLQILGHIRDAMDDESVLLIHENMLPEVGVDAFSASTDLAMMANFSALDRTEQQFITLLDQAGLELVNTWAPKGATKGVGRCLLETVPKKA